MVGFILTLLLICQPLSAYWRSFNPQYFATADWSCGNEQLAEPLAAIFSVIGDAYSTILPLVLVSRLSLPGRQKSALYGLFSLGFLVVICGAVRSVYMYRVVNTDYDFTWTLWKIWVWGECELWVAVCAASAPALKPFFRRWVDKLASSGGGGGTSAKPPANRQVPTYIVRSDGRGGLGKVKRIFASNKRKTEPGDGAWLELSDDQARAADRRSGGAVEWTKSGNHIIKSVDYDVESYPAEGPAIAMQPVGGRRN